MICGNRVNLNELSHLLHLIWRFPTHIYDLRKMGNVKSEYVQSLNELGV